LHPNIALDIIQKYLEPEHPNIVYCQQQLAQLQLSEPVSLSALPTDITKIALQEIA